MINNSNQLDDFLQLIGLSELVETPVETYRQHGKIIVIGKSNVSITVLEAVAKSLGIAKDRFLFLLD